MNNLERLKLEISFDFPVETLKIYLQENGLEPEAEYTATNSSKKAVYTTVLQVLKNVSQDIRLMKNYKTDDLSVTDFHENLMQRIDNLERDLRMMSVSDESSNSNSSVFMLFRGEQR